MIPKASGAYSRAVRGLALAWTIAWVHPSVAQTQPGPGLPVAEPLGAPPTVGQEPPSLEALAEWVRRPLIKNAPATPTPLPQPARRILRPEPWLSPAGEPLAAVVEDRTLTITELERRIDLRLSTLPPARHRDPRRQEAIEEERRLSHGAEIAEEWAKMTTLATAGRRRGFSVTEEDVRRAWAELTGPPSQAAAPAGSVVERRRFLTGIPEEMLLAEIRDALLVERYVLATLRNSYTRADYEELYRRVPSAFYVPPRARAFRAYWLPLPTLDTDEQKDLRKELDRVRAELRKRQPDYARLVEKNDPARGLAVGETGWVSGAVEILEAPSFGGPSASGLAPEFVQTLFSLAVGQTSSVFRDRWGAYHVMRVLEREEGSDRNFEAAIPLIENVLFDHVKAFLWEFDRETMQVAWNPRGLQRYGPPTETAAGQADGAAATPAPEPADAPDVRQLLGPEPRPPAVNLEILRPPSDRSASGSPIP